MFMVSFYHCHSHDSFSAACSPWLPPALLRSHWMRTTPTAARPSPAIASPGSPWCPCCRPQVPAWTCEAPGPASSGICPPVHRRLRRSGSSRGSPQWPVKGLKRFQYRGNCWDRFKKVNFTLAYSFLILLYSSSLSLSLILLQLEKKPFWRSSRLSTRSGNQEG